MTKIYFQISYKDPFIFQCYKEIATSSLFQAYRKQWV